MLNILTLIRSLMPAFVILAEAFRYGMARHGGETWKDKSAAHHANKALSALSEWLGSPRQYSLLADAALRLLFALCLSATERVYRPKEKPVEEKPK